MINNNNPDVLAIFTSLLNLSDIEVTKIRESDNGRRITIAVKSTKVHVACRQCNKPTKAHGYGRTITLRHLSLLDKETYIEHTPKRGICEDCDDRPSTTERFDWYNANAKMTKPFEQFMLFECVNSTVSDVSAKFNVDYHAIDNLINNYIESEVDFSKIASLSILGIDEISIKKGYQKYVTLISYRVDQKVHVLGVVKGRKRADIVAFLNKIPKRLVKTISIICSDLYDGYVNACRDAFDNKVPVVADRFHVQKLYRKSLVTLRKAELKRLKRKLTAHDYKQLKAAVAILKRYKDYFTENEKEVVHMLFKLSPKLKEAYAFSRQFSAIYNSHITPKEAMAQIADWILEVKASKLNCFNRFIKTLQGYEDIITNYFINRNSSGFVEGFNNKAKVLKRRCYGLSNPVKFFKRLILDTVGLERFRPGVVAF